MAKLRVPPKYCASPQTPQASKSSRQASSPSHSTTKTTPGSAIASRDAGPTKLQSFLEWLVLREVDGIDAAQKVNSSKEEDGVTVTTIHQVAETIVGLRLTPFVLF
jgi:hypothetical protein